MTQISRSELLEVLTNQLKLDVDMATISDDQLIEELGMSSLQMMKLIYIFEDEYGVTLSTQEVLEINTVGELVALLDAKTVEQRT